MGSKRPAEIKSKWPSAAPPSAKCSPTKSAPTATGPTPRPPSISSFALPERPRRSKELDVATYQILYWHEVPSQIKVEDGEDDVNLALSARFQERIDQLAAQRGLQGTDDYLAGWNWSDEQQRDGTAQHVAQQL